MKSEEDILRLFSKALSRLITAPPGEEVMDAGEVADSLGVDRKTVYDAAGRGEIPHQRLGKRLLFHRAALLEWLSCKGSSAGDN